MLSVHLFGNGPAEVIGQTRLEPTGEADGEPLLLMAGDKTGFELCPGDHVLVRTYVNARQLAAGSPPVTYGTANAFAGLPVKIRVKTCSGVGMGGMLQNQTLIDVGRQIVVPANAGIEILAPSTFTTTRPADIEDVAEYFVQVIACPVRCCYPPLPMLTFWRAVLEEVEEDPDSRTWVVPRGARRMRVGELPAGIVAVDMMHQNRIISTEQILAGDVVELFGAADRVVFQPTSTSPGNFLIVWDIEG